MVTTTGTRLSMPPEPVVLAGSVALGLVATLALPALAPHLPRAGRPEQAQWAATAAGVVAAVAVYVYAVGRRIAPADGWWLAATLAYGVGLVVVKFILSPAAFDESTDTSLGGYVATGLLVIPLYLVGLVVLAVGATRDATSRSSRLLLPALLAAGAVATRLAVAAARGEASEYLDDVAGGPGLLLPATVSLASLALTSSFRRAGPARDTAVAAAASLVVVVHGLWVVYMTRLFG